MLSSITELRWCARALPLALAMTACAHPSTAPTTCSCANRLAQRTDESLARATGEGLPPTRRLDRTITLGAVDTPSAPRPEAAASPPSARGGGPPALGPAVPILTTEPGGATTGDMGTGTTESFVGPAGPVAPQQGAQGLAPAR